MARNKRPVFRTIDLKAEYINPFVESVKDLFSTMLRCGVTRGSPGLTDKSKVAEDSDVMALIGLTGPAKGTVALTFPKTTALAAVHRFSGLAPEDIDDAAVDAMAEMVNIIAGGAKARLHDGTGAQFVLGLPTVITGQHFKVSYNSTTRWLDIPFSSEMGAFNLRVAFEVDGKK